MTIGDTTPPSALVIFFGAMCLCMLVLKISAVAGRSVGLVDRPSARKNHKGNVPLVGGVSIFVTFMVMHFAWYSAAPLILSSGLLLFVGMADDYREISPKSRLLFQAIAAGILVVLGGYQITSIGSIISSEPVVLTGLVATLFSIVCVVGVVNAINMIDGADGLAGGVVALSITALLVIAIGHSGHSTLIASLAIILGATLTFLFFNSGVLGLGHKVFLGDSGSMFLGILLASYYIGMSQGQSNYLSPVAAGWIFGLPLMDSISVMVGRIVRGKSPLKAGRDHLHHRIINSGVSSSRCVAIMLLLHATLVLIGVMGNHFQTPSPVMFWGFVGLVVAHYFVTPRIIQGSI